MEDCTKVLVYGSFDGFAYSTDDSIAISVVLDNGEKVEIPEEFIVSADQMINKYKIKLKDVIERIEKFDIGTKAVWINEILNKLGSEYGFHKYCAGYKQGKFDGAMKRERVTVPQFVENYIKYAIENDWDFQDLFKRIEDEEDEELLRWVYHERNQETLAAAWINGYTVEKEKRYTVKLKNTDDYLVKTAANGYRFYNNIYTQNRKHTKEEIEKGGFGWVFDCEGVEVKEVEE
jgi:hypothetical protein